MQFKFLAAAAALLAASSVQAIPAIPVTPTTPDITASQITDVLDEISHLSSKIANIVEHAEGPLSALDQISAELNQYLNTVRVDLLVFTVHDLNFDEEGQRQICQSFEKFVEANQHLINTVNKKDPLLCLSTCDAPIDKILHVLEWGVKSLGSDLIDALPSCRDDANDNLEDLLEAIEDATARPKLVNEK
ncbi:hypothetical protein ACJ41O_009336 [Fusarium nematophilum]